MGFRVQETPLHEELHPHSPLPVVHTEGHRGDHEGRGAVRGGARRVQFGFRKPFHFIIRPLSDLTNFTAVGDER